MSESTEKINLLEQQEGYHQTKCSIARKISDNITENVQNEKEIVRSKQKLSKLRQRQGYSRVERAFMVVEEDQLLANASISVIHPFNSNESNDNVQTKPSGPPNPTVSNNNNFNLDNNSLEKIHRELQRRERSQLLQDLGCAELNAS